MGGVDVRDGSAADEGEPNELENQKHERDVRKGLMEDATLLVENQRLMQHWRFRRPEDPEYAQARLYLP